jgi:hypothetical protein
MSKAREAELKKKNDELRALKDAKMEQEWIIKDNCKAQFTEQFKAILSHINTSSVTTIFAAASNTTCESEKILLLQLSIWLAGKDKDPNSITSKSIDILENIFATKTRDSIKIRDNKQNTLEVRKQAKLQCKFYEFIFKNYVSLKLNNHNSSNEFNSSIPSTEELKKYLQKNYQDLEIKYYSYAYDMSAFARAMNICIEHEYTYNTLLVNNFTSRCIFDLEYDSIINASRSLAVGGIFDISGSSVANLQKKESPSLFCCYDVPVEDLKISITINFLGQDQTT